MTNLDTELTKLIQEIGDICHQKYLGSYKREDRYDEWMYAYEDEVINLLDTPEVMGVIQALITAAETKARVDELENIENSMGIFPLKPRIELNLRLEQLKATKQVKGEQHE